MLGSFGSASRISIHAPTKGATICSNRMSFIVAISIHAPTKGATKPVVYNRIREAFQSTLPRRERRSGCTPGLNRVDFNPRSHEGSDPSFSSVFFCLSISIHAPTKGATVVSNIRQPTKLYFNPRSHEGSDVSKRTARDRVNISIHAPTKGATIQYSVLLSASRISIHAPTKGATRLEDCKMQEQARFQSTLPRRERLRTWRRSTGALNFNPRSHEGSDYSSWLT